MTDNDIIKANDILDKLDFFGGQRAGRELWFDKPEKIQNEDIEAFSKDLVFLRGFIEDQKAEIEELEKYKHDYYVLKSEARQEFAERVKVEIALNTRISNEDYLDIDSDIENLLAEMESEWE